MVDLKISNQIVLLKAKKSDCLIESAMKLHFNFDDKMLFFSHKDSSFIKDSFEMLKQNMSEFDEMYKNIRFMFLKESWSILDEMYGKAFFISEVQKLMKDEEITTFYFHRVDAYFEGSSVRDIERIAIDIIELANYYQKKIYFSLSEDTRLGKLIQEVLHSKVDLELSIAKNSSGNCYRKTERNKKESIDFVLFSDKKELIDFHKYIFGKRTFINFKHLEKLDKNSQEIVKKADIIVYNSQDVSTKDNLLKTIKKLRLSTKFLLLSDDEIIRKRDKIDKIKKGISQVYEKHYNLLLYIYSIEKIISRDFYTTSLKDNNIKPKVRYYSNKVDFENIGKEYAQYGIYFSVVVVNYKNDEEIKKELVENCIREPDVVYHNKKDKNLIFLMVDILPSLSLVLISKRLEKVGVKIDSKQTFDVQSYFTLKKESIKLLKQAS